MSDPTQAQAEDRRAQIEDRLDAYDRARFFGGGFGPQWEGFAPVAADLYRNAPADIAWLLAELSRLSRELDAQIQESRRLLTDRDAFWLRVESLSRVEQALREQFTNLLASATQLVDSHPGRFRYLEYDVRALSASPEAQPEEGR